MSPVSPTLCTELLYEAMFVFGGVGGAIKNMTLTLCPPEADDLIGDTNCIRSINQYTTNPVWKKQMLQELRRGSQ